ncbi:MtrAB system histidine kinase MtrB [Scrofimicrobium canadense]|uniref:MtrAB system histidine kinase MtrB n=1 Tax=Scrofimicrobium canadense TaxID=2652290 RepID=UPI00298E19DF|nr:MtrAB system histidine kinase MtrB [Scrofimicrobium canadense]
MALGIVQAPTHKQHWWSQLALWRSFSARVAITLALVLLLLLLLVGVFVASQLQTQMFQTRKAAILEDASVRFTQAQSQLDQSTAVTVDQVQELTAGLVSATADSAAGAGVISVMMLRSSESSDSFIINEYADTRLRPIITEQLQTTVGEGQAAWQSVAVPSGRGSVPGIVVGNLMEVPQAGPYEFFIVYSLESEQNTVGLAIRTFFVAAVPLAVAMSIATFALIYHTLRPVRSTAAAAEQIAAGDLESRVDVHGQDEMARLGSAFNDMADSLQNQINEYGKLAELQQRFVSDVSHELRTPLTTIRMAEDMIYDVRDELDAIPKRSAELLHSEVARLEEMLADLLEISRYDAQSAQLDWETVDVYMVVEKTIAENQELAEHLGVSVSLSPRPDRPTAEADGKRLERVVRNLLVNAYEHAEGKPVDVTVATSEHSVAVSVRDHGVGMNSQTMKRVFDRFFRADPARARTTGGTGLGLAIAREDVAAHGGQLHVDGRLGVGSVFVMTIPRKAGTPVFEFPCVAKVQFDEEN